MTFAQMWSTMSPINKALFIMAFFNAIAYVAVGIYAGVI